MRILDWTPGCVPDEAVWPLMRFVVPSQEEWRIASWYCCGVLQFSCASGWDGSVCSRGDAWALRPAAMVRFVGRPEASAAKAGRRWLLPLVLSQHHSAHDAVSCCCRVLVGLLQAFGSGCPAEPHRRARIQGPRGCSQVWLCAELPHSHKASSLCKRCHSGGVQGQHDSERQPASHTPLFPPHWNQPCVVCLWPPSQRCFCL